MASSRDYLRGQEYWEAGRVGDVVSMGESTRARVYGAQHHYDVRVDQNLRATCTCMHMGPRICRHAVGAMFAILNANRGTFKWFDSSERKDASEPVDFLDPVTAVRPSPIGKGDPKEVDGIPGHASQIMSTSVVSLSPDTSLKEAWDLVREKRFRHIPVLDADGSLVGIVSDRDLLKVAADFGKAWVESADDAIKVRDLMKTKILTASPDTSLLTIAKVLFEERIGAMPVLDENGQLVGMITRSDILRMLVKHAPEKFWV